LGFLTAVPESMCGVVLVLVAMSFFSLLRSFFL
jgi:hypothetical protein